MKKLAILLFILFLLAGCAEQDPLREISDAIGTDVTGGTLLEHTDSHGGFLGDGERILCVRLTEEQAAELADGVRESEFWHPLPLSEELSAAVCGTRTETESFGPLFPEGAVPPVENGFWFFRDRHSQSTAPASTAGLHDRSSWNFTAAIFDADTSILYYLELDT
ncbi:MAG: hypothetical protein E7451_05180 [Ruminococcaceae bacterium]|nr:hypothetical protein [Oscillospiraceae bacterium]